MAKRVTLTTKILLALGSVLGARMLMRAVLRERIDGKVIVITGGSRGLGLDLGRALAARGCKVAFCARDVDEVERARKDVASYAPGGEADVHAVVCDASRKKEVNSFLEKVAGRFGEVDVLITCAATIQVGPAQLMTRADYEDSFNQIFWTAYVPTMAVLPQMRQRKRGHVVHITSFGGKVAAPHLLPYSTAKFAATGFSAGLRAELAQDGVRVTTITPGLLRTGAHVNVPLKGQQEKEFAWFALGATLPLVSLSAERAALQIIAAIEHGDTEPIMDVGARLATILAAAAPGLTSRLLRAQNAALPAYQGGSPTRARAEDIAQQSSSPLVQAIDAYGAPNAAEHNEFPGPLHVEPKLT